MGENYAQESEGVPAPSPPRGEGRGEGETQRGFSRRHAMRPPHPNPLPGGERGSCPVEQDQDTHPPPPYSAGAVMAARRLRRIASRSKVR
ncbi:hypothetical protein FZ983_06230 [Azospirillum sp. B21]|nr:hypothetical protein FZ983_06230 [Azospirillum sp. B21]